MSLTCERIGQMPKAAAELPFSGVFSHALHHGGARCFCSDMVLVSIFELMQSAELGVDDCMSPAEPVPLIVQRHNPSLVVLG